LSTLKRLQDVCTAKIGLKARNAIQNVRFRAIVVWNVLFAIQILQEFIVAAKADDREGAVDREGSDEDAQGLDRELHAIAAPHAATAIDYKQKVEIGATTQLHLVGLLVLHDLKEVLRLLLVKSWHECGRDGDLVTAR